MNIIYKYPYYPYLKIRFTTRNQTRAYDIDAYVDTGFYDNERAVLIIVNDINKMSLRAKRSNLMP